MCAPDFPEGQIVHTRHMMELEDREVEVMRQLSAGADVLTIAKHFGISDRTIKTIVNQLVTKMGVHNRVELIAEALRKGYIQ